LELIIQKNKIDASIKSGLANVSEIRNESVCQSKEPDSFNTEKQLIPLHKVQSEFINIASHEMKTPVQSILTYSELLHSRPNEYREEYIEAIYRNAIRLQKLSENLLDSAKIEDQTLVLKNEKFDINDLISCTIQDFVTQTQNCGIKIGDMKFLFSPWNSIYVCADKDRIAQVISNLIDNAFRFTQEGSITVEADLQNDGVIVSVKDCGSGISPHMVSRLFSKFSTSSYSGTGLGLYISKKIVEQHGGRIWGKNNADRGATFSFEIPSRIRARDSHIIQKAR
jgi:two-component system, OmpR family, sensor histidine kinase VicK